MLGPYRDSAPVEADPLLPLPDACVPGGTCPSACPYVAPRRAKLLSPAFAKALSASATLLLLVGSASISAVTWTVTSTILGARSAQTQDEDQAAIHERAPVRLVALGGATHEPDVLWARAQRFAASEGALTLARATVAPEALEAASVAARVEHDPGPNGGLVVADAGAGSQAALLGFRRGDLVTAVNGFGLLRPQDAVRAYTASRARGCAVIEVLRDGRPVAIRVDAQTDESQGRRDDGSSRGGS